VEGERQVSCQATSCKGRISERKRGYQEEGTCNANAITGNLVLRKKVAGPTSSCCEGRKSVSKS
jgi:hypothetical protein